MSAYAYAVEEIADPHKGLSVLLPPEALSVLTQVRGDDFDIKEDLLPSILATKQLVPGVAVALTPDQAGLYISQWNEIFGSTHTIDDLRGVVLDGDLYYLPLIAGHRRRATCIAVNEMVRQGKVPDLVGHDGRYRVEIRFGLSAEQAIDLQFNENRHSVPPPQREARKAWGYYRFLQRRNPELTHGEFARRIGRTTDWMLNAMRFCSLPVSIQSYVDGDNRYGVKLSYGTLLHLARLSEGLRQIGVEFPEDAQHWWALSAISDGLDTTSFGKRVSSFLTDKREEANGQLALFGSQLSTAEMERHVRQRIDSNLTRVQWMHNAWLDHVAQIVGGGAFGAENPLDLLQGPNAISM